MRYLLIVTTTSHKQESLLLGMDFKNVNRSAKHQVCIINVSVIELLPCLPKLTPSYLLSLSDDCTIGLVLPVWSDTQVYLDGDG